MPEDNKDFDNLEIKTEDILPADELEAEPVEAADTLPAEPDPVPETVEETEADDTEPEQGEEAGEDDGLITVLQGLRDSVEALNARIQASENKLAVYEKREAARSTKLTGFFAPIKDGRDPDADPLPRIEKKYIF